MRILSPASDVPTLAPLRHDAKNADSIANTQAETMSARNPSIAVTSTVPTVVLDTDIVSDNMAARLCASFLGHVLFLKNQVPFPIVQLARMPMGDNTTRAAKKRHELLNSFDTLASHLYTTFIALSTALALRGVPEKAEVGTGAAVMHPREHGVARAFFAVALGPTVGTARSRVIVGIDGLETKVWGLREDNIPDKGVRTRGGSEENEYSSESESDTDDEDQDEDEESEGEESGHSSEEEEEEESDGGAPLPPSRSPSPEHSSDSDSSPSTSQSNVPEKTPLPRTEDPESVRAAERLLSRTLASACAEDDGQGLAAEMAPTQIHVLLRAPRRFDHPSWVPRQNLCTSLDNYLADFLMESGQTSARCDTTTKSKKRTKASKIQGVWIRSRGSCTQTEGFEEDLAEEDELIWWSWDGVLAGFTDW